MSDMVLLDLDRIVDPVRAQWIQLALATPVVLWGGWPFFWGAVHSLRTRNLMMFTRCGLGLAIAYLFSIVATLTPHLFPPAFRDHSGRVGVYFEAAAVITTLVLLGQLLELKARGSTSSALRALLELAPPTAMKIVAPGQEREVSLEQLSEGERLRVRPGDKVPVEGIVEEGSSNIDESMVRGEPLQVAKTIGARVTGGTVNQNGDVVLGSPGGGKQPQTSTTAHLVGGGR